MDFAYSERVEELRSRLLNFFDEHIRPNDRLYHHQLAEAPDRWQPVPIVEELKPKARAAGLWNLFLPHWSAAPAFPTWNTRRSPRSWAESLGRARCSTAPRPTRATWRR